MTEVSSVADFKKKSKDDGLLMPSGAVIKARRAGMQTFMRAGIIPNSLMAIVESNLAKGTPIDEGSFHIEDAEQIDEFVKMVDNVAVFCFVEPKLHEIPSDESTRDEELLYLDEVDDEDKMFIFQWATGGTRDVEQFRREAGGVLETVRAGKGLENTSEYTPAHQG